MRGSVVLLMAREYGLSKHFELKLLLRMGLNLTKGTREVF